MQQEKRFYLFIYKKECIQYLKLKVFLRCFFTTSPSTEKAKSYSISRFDC